MRAAIYIFIQKNELDNRLENHKSNPDDVLDWKILKN